MHALFLYVYVIKHIFVLTKFVFHVYVRLPNPQSVSIVMRSTVLYPDEWLDAFFSVLCVGVFVLGVAD